MKKLLILGGSRYIIPVIETAKNLGVYTITCDYLPNNIGHKFSDEYHNISITDKDKVYELAKRLEVDGIMSFATDPGVIAAAYACEKLGLPTSPLNSIEILQNKDKFREFLAQNDFNVPKSWTVSTYEEIRNKNNEFIFPLIVKPVDSAGSKGVSKVSCLDDLEKAIGLALKFSLRGKCILEEFIESEGYSSDTDSFSVNGKLEFLSFNNQLFDEKSKNPYTPSAYIWPSFMHNDVQHYLGKEIQRLITLLDMKTSIYNIETRLGKDGKPYIMECAPRAGGNRLSEILKLATGQDLIQESILAAIGEKPIYKFKKPNFNGYWIEIILHSNKEGFFNKIIIDDDLMEKYVKEVDVWVNKGDFVDCFDGANNAIGTLVLFANTKSQALNIVKNIHKEIIIVVE